MNEKMWKKCVETLLTCDGQSKVKKGKALLKMLVFSAFMGLIIGLCSGIILGKSI